MSKNKVKVREWKQRQDAARRDASVLEPRRFDSDLIYAGAGILRVRLVLIPPWEALRSWEIRSTDTMTLYLSDGVTAGGDLVVGFTPLDVEHQELETIVGHFQNLRLPPIVEYQPTAVLDGTRLVVQLGGGIECSSRFRWVLGHAPDAWSALEALALSAITRFDTASPRESAG